MSKYEKPPYQPAVSRGRDINEGLRSYMLQVYNYMGAALGLTGVVAFLVMSSAPLNAFFIQSPVAILFVFLPLVIAIGLSFKIDSLSFPLAKSIFWLYAATMGISMSAILSMYSGESIARVFFITAGTFGAMSLYGYTTKRDLSGMGSFMMMGLIGLILASIVNIFLGSSLLQFALSVIGVIVFTGLTAWDSQRIREMYDETSDSDSLGKVALMGALTLYLDFINLFISLLRILGERK